VRHFSLPLLTVLALLPGLAAAQEFPPPEAAARLDAADDGPGVGPILSVGLGWAGPFSLNFADEGRSAFKDFKAGRVLHGLAGLRIGGFGMAAILRRATPGVAGSPLACPDVGGCTASGSQNGGVLMYTSAGEPGPVAFSVGLGFWLDRTEIERPGGELFRRYDGWALIEYVSVEARVGGPTSHFGVGGYGLLALTGLTKKVENGVSTSLSGSSDSPGWAEIGLRVSFF
jgi:hypothetical protein